MEVMLECAQRFPETNIIWITSDRLFAGVTIRNHIYDFIERPCARDRIEKSIKEG